jgi:Uri superfamily endonuclease
LPKYNTLIEYQGQQHYLKKGQWIYTDDAIKKMKIRDQIKRDFCTKNSINLIEIPYWDIDKIEQIIQEKILNI